MAATETAGIAVTKQCSQVTLHFMTSITDRNSSKYFCLIGDYQYVLPPMMLTFLSVRVPFGLTVQKFELSILIEVLNSFS